MCQLQSVRKFVYDGWKLTAEINESGSLERNYAWSSELLVVGQNGNLHQVGHDASQNVAVLVQANTGKSVAVYEYDPFGLVLKAIGDFADQNPFRYSSQYMDNETGLLYYGLRFYNPQPGRWISRDPSEEAGGLNVYAFASNDGINRVEPHSEKVNRLQSLALANKTVVKLEKTHYVWDFGAKP